MNVGRTTAESPKIYYLFAVLYSKLQYKQNEFHWIRLFFTRFIFTRIKRQAKYVN